MGSSHSLAIRQQIVSLRTEGLSFTEISEQLCIGYRSVLNLWHRYEVEGSKGLLPHYALCGSNKKSYEDRYRSAVLALKQNHPRWGAPRLRLAISQQLSENSPNQWVESRLSDNLPSIRTIQRWLTTVRTHKPPRRRNEPRIGASLGVHNIWQVDAKEHINLADGSKACYLTVVDEYSGAWLGATVFPP